MFLKKICFWEIIFCVMHCTDYLPSIIYLYLQVELGVENYLDRFTDI
jgi:hypothetical protein